MKRLICMLFGHRREWTRDARHHNKLWGRCTRCGDRQSALHPDTVKFFTDKFGDGFPAMAEFLRKHTGPPL